MINKENYHISSEGNFRAVPGSWARKITSQSRCGWEFSDEDDWAGHWACVVPSSIRLGNHDWFLNYKSYSRRYNAVSIYFVSRNGEYLLRLSDHWSTSELSTVRCGDIASCRWSLKGSVQPVTLPGHDKPVVAGMIRLQDLHWRR